MELLFPPTIEGENMAVRVMYLKYDHLSELSNSYNLPASSVRTSLLKATNNEWRTKLLYKYRESTKTSQQEMPFFR